MSIVCPILWYLLKELVRVLGRKSHPNFRFFPKKNDKKHSNNYLFIIDTILLCRYINKMETNYYL